MINITEPSAGTERFLIQQLWRILSKGEPGTAALNRIGEA